MVALTISAMSAKHAPTIARMMRTVTSLFMMCLGLFGRRVAVLAAQPDKAKVEALQAFAAKGERIAVVGNVAYLHTPDGFGTSKLAVKFDKGIGVPNTARNWNTVLKLQELAEKVDS
jgi:hypothetical protein